MDVKRALGWKQLGLIIIMFFLVNGEEEVATSVKEVREELKELMTMAREEHMKMNIQLKQTNGLERMKKNSILQEITCRT